MIAIAAAPRLLPVSLPVERQPIVAAVHAGSQRFSDILARARAKSIELGCDVVFLTVVTRRAASNELFTIRMRLARWPLPVRLEVTSIDRDGLSRAERETQIAEALIKETRKLGAQSIVLGHDCLAAMPPAGVVGRVAESLSTDIELCFGVPGFESPTDLEPVSQTSPKSRDMGVVHLTDDGRRLLTSRVARIERHEIPKARARLRRHAGSSQALAEYERQVNEFRRLSYLVEHAPSTSDLLDDPDRVELGEQVSLELEGGGQRRLLVVDPVEVTRGRACVSATSGIGKALLGRKIGESAAIPTAHGLRIARILSATR